MYTPTSSPNVPLDSDTLVMLLSWLEAELREISAEFNRGVESILLEEMHTAPDRPRTGMIVLADGTNWNPGAGAGYYGYYGGAWNKLG